VVEEHDGRVAFHEAAGRGHEHAVDVAGVERAQRRPLALGLAFGVHHEDLIARVLQLRAARP
jgi:hypothetical protein